MRQNERRDALSMSLPCARMDAGYGLSGRTRRWRREENSMCATMKMPFISALYIGLGASQPRPCCFACCALCACCAICCALCACCIWYCCCIWEAQRITSRQGEKPAAKKCAQRSVVTCVRMSGRLF